ncbi:hypothetical protein [Lactiplantibacillus plantarum]|uniref:hypothetical protein n=1 Tax=Lactiplantibacillus plantarum TaxID=1590 RepID=UPI0026550DFC|nr:hypothetical protein [Lactiplantibacillus plantarum]MDN7036875.1 hypothetical protein [Lactiplantibacillus plantarum]
MDFTDVYGIKHENCTLIAPTEEYRRIIIFMDSVGRRFVAISPNPEPTKYGSAKSHWKQGKPNDVPKEYFHIDKKNC